jgi:hypothetical protein
MVGLLLNEAPILYGPEIARTISGLFLGQGLLENRLGIFRLAEPSVPALPSPS